MFIGKQNDLICLISDNKQDLLNSGLQFTDIVETNEKYIFNGSKYILEKDYIEQLKKEKNKENIQKAKNTIENGFVIFKNAEFETNAQTVSDLTATMLMLQAQQNACHSELVSESDEDETLKQGQGDNMQVQSDTPQSLQTIGTVACTHWLSKDDKVVELSLEDFTTLGLLISNYKNEVWNTKYITFKNQIELASTVESLTSIEILY